MRERGFPFLRFRLVSAVIRQNQINQILRFSVAFFIGEHLGILLHHLRGNLFRRGVEQHQQSRQNGQRQKRHRRAFADIQKHEQHGADDASRGKVSVFRQPHQLGTRQKRQPSAQINAHVVGINQSQHISPARPRHRRQKSASQQPPERQQKQANQRNNQQPHAGKQHFGQNFVV